VNDNVVMNVRYVASGQDSCIFQLGFQCRANALQMRIDHTLPAQVLLDERSPYLPELFVAFCLSHLGQSRQFTANSNDAIGRGCLCLPNLRCLVRVQSVAFSLFRLYPCIDFVEASRPFFRRFLQLAPSTFNGVSGLRKVMLRQAGVLNSRMLVVPVARSGNPQ